MARKGHSVSESMITQTKTARNVSMNNTTQEVFWHQSVSYPA